MGRISSEGLLFTWRAKAEVYSTWRKAHHGLESFLCLWDTAGRGGDYERPRRGNFSTPGDGKINRGIRVKSKTGFRCLEEAAMGEFNPSEEGSKPTPHLISSYSKAFLELRHGVGTRPPFPKYPCWPRAQLLRWHWRKKA